MLPLIIFILLVLAIDLYSFRGLKILLGRGKDRKLPPVMVAAYWFIPIMLVAAVVFTLFFRPARPHPFIFNLNFYILAYTLLFYMPKLIFIFFHFIEEVAFQAEKGWLSLRGPRGQNSRRSPERSDRLILSKLGTLLAIIPVIAILYGVVIGRFNLNVVHKEIEFASLPRSFDGFRIVHISDLHIGSFYGYDDRVERIVEVVNGQDADIIVFTGDLVNNFTSEIDGFIDVLSQLDAPHGMYSVLGNHDYGDYYQWPSEEARKKNMSEMLAAHERMGFRLLMNEWDAISVNGEVIAVIGVENWGEPPFPRYGNLEKAMAGTDRIPFRLLLSHDPSHWDAEVVGTGIELTLSGHTHGMQLGIENGFMKWSPGRMKYPRWGGLYREGKQLLYVNRGLGWVAFPGRIGMPPEITVLTLKAGNQM